MAAPRKHFICVLHNFLNFEDATAPIVDDEQYLDNMKIENGEC